MPAAPSSSTAPPPFPPQKSFGEKTLFSRLGATKSAGSSAGAGSVGTLGTTPCVALRRQYRCHPAISALANAHFYGGSLLDGIAAVDRPPVLPGLPPFSVIQVSPERAAPPLFQAPPGSSKAAFSKSPSLAPEAATAKEETLVSVPEAASTAAAVSEFIRSGVGPERLGIICVYKNQVSLVRRRLAEVASSDPELDRANEVMVSTVDAFQGAERDVILLSCVASRYSPFVDDPRRLNVALTRAKAHLVILAHCPAFEGNPEKKSNLGSIIGAARRAGYVYGNLRELLAASGNQDDARGVPVPPAFGSKLLHGSGTRSQPDNAPPCLPNLASLKNGAAAFMEASLSDEEAIGDEPEEADDGNTNKHGIFGGDENSALPKPTCETRAGFSDE